MLRKSRRVVGTLSALKVDARTNGATNGSWVRNVTDNDSRLLTNLTAAGKSVRIQFSNDLTTKVAVQVSGSWRSN